MSATERAAAHAPRALARAALGEVVVYDTDRTPCAVELADNTNPFGAPPSALRAVREAAAEDFFQYPGTQSAAVRGALAAYAGVPPETIITGCGSDELIASAFRALAEPGEAVAYSDPTFSIVPSFARVAGLVPVPVPFGRELDIDADALLATGARIIYLCTPNNPTGTEASRAAVERVLERAPGVVVVDEAYAEYATAQYMPLAPAHGRLLVTRTLSKAFGLAGMRIGYGAGAPALLGAVEKARGPYTVNALAERAALAALAHDVAWMREGVRQTRALRERLTAELRARGYAPFPSAANFVLVPLPGAAVVAERLRARGVAVRAFRALAGVGDALRISVGAWPVMAAALDALDAVRAAGDR